MAWPVVPQLFTEYIVTAYAMLVTIPIAEILVLFFGSGASFVAWRLAANSAADHSCDHR